MLRDAIDRSGETRAQWARALGISESFLSQLCTGAKRPGLDLAFAIEERTGGAVPVSCWKRAAQRDAAADSTPSTCGEAA